MLNRKPVLEEIKNDQVEKKENKGAKVPEDIPPEKKIIKLSELSTKEVVESYIILVIYIIFVSIILIVIFL